MVKCGILIDHWKVTVNFVFSSSMIQMVGVFLLFSVTELSNTYMLEADGHLAFIRGFSWYLYS